MNQQNDFNNQPLENLPPQRTYVTYVPYGLTPETYEERLSIRKRANTIGGAFLIVLAINAGLLFVLQAIMVALSLSGVTLFQKYLSEPAFLQVLQVLLSTVMFTFPFILLFKANGFRISGLIKFKKPKKEDILPFFLLGVGFCSFANMAVSFMGSIFQSFGIKYEVDFGDKPEGFLGFMLTVIATAVVPALVEEFACRGLVLGLLRKFGEGFAVTASAILFGVMHGNFQQIPFAILTGLVLGYIVIKTKTIWIAVAVHFFNNFSSVVLDYLFKGMGIEIQNIIYAIYLTVCLCAGIFAVYLLKNKMGAYKFKKAKNKSSRKQIIKWFYTAPTVIIFMILCLLEALTFFK